MLYKEMALIVELSIYLDYNENSSKLNYKKQS